jgi:hypothetical protein
MKACVYSLVDFFISELLVSMEGEKLFALWEDGSSSTLPSPKKKLVEREICWWDALGALDYLVPAYVEFLGIVCM